jgi:CheY-like chemotaxis protein
MSSSRARSALLDDPKGHAAGWPMSARRILVAESYVDARELLVMALDDAGYLIEAVGTGTELLAVANEWLPDAIILDVALPTLDGLQAMRILKRNPRLRDAVFVVLTGHERQRAAARRAGCAHFFVKPIELRSLLAVLPSAMGER